MPDAAGLRWERRAWEAGCRIVAGVDEAGRGAWAGPLVAAAVALPRDPRQRARLTRALRLAGAAPRDSKLLTAAQRQRVLLVLQEASIPYAVAVIEPAELDQLGLGPANRAALCRAVNALQPEPEHVLVDAYRLDALPCPHDAIVHGDRLSQAIALASIVAKVRRDEIMLAVHEELPHYGFADHKGYGTANHAAAVERHGPSPYHRRSFAPIARLCGDVPAAG